MKKIIFCLLIIMLIIVSCSKFFPEKEDSNIAGDSKSSTIEVDEYFVLENAQGQEVKILVVE